MADKQYLIDRKYLDTIKPIDDELFKKIRKEGTKTGSKVFGGWEDGHDVDYIMPIDFSPNFGDGIHKFLYCLCTDYDLVNNPPENGVIAVNAITKGGTVLNLLFPIDEDAYRTWIKATEIMQFIISQNETIAKNVTKKSKRIALFRAIREALE